MSAISTRDSDERREAEELEAREWLDSLDYVIRNGGPRQVRRLLRRLQRRAAEFGISLPFTARTPYINTLPRHEQARFPGNREIERRIRSLVRWNAMAMVLQRQPTSEHRRSAATSATYASAATHDGSGP